MSHSYSPSEEGTRKPTPLGKPAKHSLVPMAGFAPFLLCVAVFLWAPSLAAQILGYTHRGSYLYELYLEGENPIV